MPKKRKVQKGDGFFGDLLKGTKKVAEKTKDVVLAPINFVTSKILGNLLGKVTSGFKSPKAQSGGAHPGNMTTPFDSENYHNVYRSAAGGISF